MLSLRKSSVDFVAESCDKFAKETAATLTPGAHRDLELVKHLGLTESRGEDIRNWFLKPIRCNRWAYQKGASECGPRPRITLFADCLPAIPSSLFSRRLASLTRRLSI